MQKVIIDPSNRMKYSSFYIKGLQDVFGASNISFSSKYFNGLNRKSDSHSFDHYMAFVIINDDKIQRVIVDYRDKTNIKKNAYNWCDRYAKINFNRELSKDFPNHKIISITPGFGISIWGFWKTTYHCVYNLAKCSFSPLESLRAHLMDYYGLYFRRSEIESYYNDISSTKREKLKKSEKQYIFFISTLWQHDNCIKGTNLIRKKFIEFCKINDRVDFEGGFYSNTTHPQFEEFKDIIFLNRYSIDDYIYKTKLSSFVFNTPAVFDCHGWKLGEFLSMGKAIISTPILNELPEKLIHSENIHIIANDLELKDAINKLLNNKNYKRHLETNAKAYYEKYGSPKSVIEYILEYKVKQKFTFE